MSPAPDLGDPVAVLLAVHDALREAGLESAVYGGLALAMYGTPRETRDADFAVAGVSAESALRALTATSIRAALAFDRAQFGGNLVSRITLLGDADTPGLNTADFVEPRSPRYAREALDRALEGELRDQAVRVLTPEDFVLFKLLSTRDRDLEDAASVMRALEARIDTSFVEREVALLQHEIEVQDVSGRWKRLAALLGGER